MMGGPPNFDIIGPGTSIVQGSGGPLTKGDVGLGSVDNTSDADKPVSTAAAAALAGKQGRWNVRVVATVGGGSSWTLAAYDHIEVDATLGAATVSPPSTPVVGDEVTIKKTDASTNPVTFQGALDGSTNPSLIYRYGTFRAVWDGSVWVRPDRHTLTSAPDYSTLRGGANGLGS